MEKTILQNETEAERIQILKDSCEKTELFTYPRAFPSEEIIKKKDEVVFKTNKLFKLDELKKEKVAEMNTEIKDLKVDQIQLVNEVTTGKEDITDDVYLLAEQDEGVMGYYSRDGELVYERPLLPTERQLSIMTKLKSN